MVVVIGRFHFPDASTRALTRSAVTFCSGVCGKIADRYCVPASLALTVERGRIVQLEEPLLQ